MIKGQRCLVTGGAGTIGSTITDQLVAAGAAEVVVLDNLVRGRRENLAGALASGTVRLAEGDILFLRTGHARKRREEGPWEAAVAKAGLHTSVMPLLHERGVAAIGWDGDGETVPSQCEGVAYPIHAIGICAMGLYYADSLSFEDLAVACEQERRWEFFCVIAPLRIEKGTGSPVNPIAIF